MNTLGEVLAQILVNNSQDVVAARYASRQHTAGFGFTSKQAIQISTAISELARNIIQHAKAPGTITIYRTQENGKTGITVQAVDKGVGIADVDAIIHKSNTVMSGGLFGTRRFANDFKIVSRTGAGTTVLFRKWLSS